MAGRALNDRTLKALKPAKPGQRYEVGDAAMPGLVVRVTERGTKTFALVARYPGSNNPTRRALGEYGAIGLAEAREKARHWLALIAKGTDPNIEVERQRLAEQRKQADTFAAVAEKFFTRKLKTQRRGFVVERIVRNELLPSWGGRPVSDITHRDIRELVERVVDRGAPTYAHNVFDAANAVLNFAAAQDMIDANPARLLKRNAVIGPKRHRQRVLGDTELRAFWRASGQLDYPFGPFFRLLLLTGCRLDELGGARWREFNLERKTWTIPAERFKSDAEHMVPLTDDALAALATLPRFSSGDYLFSTTFGKAPVRGFSKAKERLDRHMLNALGELAELRGDDPTEVKLTGFVNHDLRRTVRTRLSALKVQDHVAELVIGHGRRGIARIYDQHRFEDEKREALAKWAMLLRSIVEPPPANVVPLPKGEGLIMIPKRKLVIKMPRAQAEFLAGMLDVTVEQLVDAVNNTPFEQIVARMKAQDNQEALARAAPRGRGRPPLPRRHLRIMVTIEAYISAGLTREDAITRAADKWALGRSYVEEDIYKGNKFRQPKSRLLRKQFFGDTVEEIDEAIAQFREAERLERE